MRNDPDTEHPYEQGCEWDPCERPSESPGEIISFLEFTVTASELG